VTFDPKLFYHAGGIRSGISATALASLPVLVLTGCLAHEAHSRKKHTSRGFNRRRPASIRSSVHALRAPDIGLACNALAPPTERLAAGYMPAANKFYLVPVS